MMGHNGGAQNRLFYSFNLDDHVPASLCFAASISFSSTHLSRAVL
jgi:hypothetical protein